MKTSSDEEADLLVGSVKTNKKRKKGKGLGWCYIGRGHPHGKKAVTVADTASTISPQQDIWIFQLKVVTTFTTVTRHGAPI
jgi:hypothetical protein